MCKLKWKLGYPVYCPFQIKFGGVWNLPFVRLDDILMKESESEASVNFSRHQENLELKSTLQARKEYLRVLRSGAKSSPGPSRQPSGHELVGSGERDGQDAGQLGQARQKPIEIPPLQLDFASE